MPVQRQNRRHISRSSRCRQLQRAEGRPGRAGYVDCFGSRTPVSRRACSSPRLAEARSGHTTEAEAGLLSPGARRPVPDRSRKSPDPVEARMLPA